MAICDVLLKEDISINCDDPIVPGVESEGIIINRSDIDFAATTFNATRKNVIETLVLKSKKKGFQMCAIG